MQLRYHIAKVERESETALEGTEHVQLRTV